MLNYKGLRGTLEKLVISDAKVTAHIDELMARNPLVIPVTGRCSAPGDELVLDYAGYCDGIQFEGGTAEKQTLVLGSHTFIPGFEEQLVGFQPGDAVDVQVTFPEQYHAPNLAGKPAIFKCRIHEVRQRQKYDDGDAFAREVCGLESMNALREQVREGLQRYADDQAEEELKLRLLDEVASSCPDDITPEELEAAVQQQIDLLSAQLSHQGLTLDAYCQFTGKTLEQLRQDCTPDARKGLLRQRALTQIAEAEGIEADEASVTEAIQELCRENHVSLEQLLPHLDENARNAIVQSVINAKTLDRIRELAHVTVKETRE